MDALSIIFIDDYQKVWGGSGTCPSDPPASAEDSDVDGIIKHRIDDFIASLDASA